jgi:hypothetical protein
MQKLSIRNDIQVNLLKNLSYIRARLVTFQCLRGIAIIVVLAFHLYPNYVNKGFVGVDIFFVLSGFLMTNILLKETITYQSTLCFYQRRLCRILPAYASTTLIALCVGNCLLIPADLSALATDQLWALGFVSNFQPFFEVSVVHNYPVTHSITFDRIATIWLNFSNISRNIEVMSMQTLVQNETTISFITKIYINLSSVLLNMFTKFHHIKKFLSKVLECGWVILRFSFICFLNYFRIRAILHRSTNINLCFIHGRYRLKCNFTAFHRLYF